MHAGTISWYSAVIVTGFEVFTAKIRIVVLYIVRSGSIVSGYTLQNGGDAFLRNADNGVTTQMSTVHSASHILEILKLCRLINYSFLPETNLKCSKMR
jgi:hypothetical protein